MFESELKKYRLNSKDVLTEEISEKLIRKLSVKTLDNLFASLGYGDIQMRQVMPTIREAFIKPKNKSPVKQMKYRDESQGVIVEGMTNMLIRLAKCCNPIPGDNIIGFITRGSGITVHRSDCTNFSSSEQNSARFIEVEWNPHQSEPYLTNVKITAIDRPGLLNEITTIIHNKNTAIRGISAKVNNNQMTSIIVNFDIENVNNLNRIIQAIQTISSVVEVHRI